MSLRNVLLAFVCVWLCWPHSVAVADPALSAAVLPSGRAGQVGDPLTVFATLIAVDGTATECGITPIGNLPVEFGYQTTDANNAVTGSPSTPVDVTGSQTFVLTVTPTAAFQSSELSFTFDCSNSAPAPTISGVNTLVVSASETPVPDIIALAATPNNDGNLRATADSVAFSVASFNLGSSDDIQIRVSTGDAVLPLTLAVCETDPGTGSCLAAPSFDAVWSRIDAGASATFGVFATADGPIAADAANNRVFVSFFDAAGELRGSTSVAAQSVASLIGDYTASLNENLAGCLNQGGQKNGPVVGTGSLSITSQDGGGRFAGTGQLTVLPPAVASFDVVSLTGTVAQDGSVSGAFTTDLSINGSYDSTTDYEYTGTFVNGILNLQFTGNDVAGDVCRVSGTLSASN